MSQIESKTGVTLEVDKTYGAARVSLRALDTVDQEGRKWGHFSLSARSGGITGAPVVAGAPVFSFRWPDTERALLLTQLEAYYVPTTAFTAAQELGLDAIGAFGFTVADSGGTAVAPNDGQRMSRRQQRATGFGATDINIANATLLTAGTRTLDPHPFVGGSGIVNVVNAAAGTQYLNPSKTTRDFGFNWQADASRGEMPMQIERNEGVVIRNLVIFPAAGVAFLRVNMRWLECLGY